MAKDYLDDINSLTYQGFALNMGPKDKRHAGWRKQRDAQGYRTGRTGWKWLKVGW